MSNSLIRYGRKAMAVVLAALVLVAAGVLLPSFLLNRYRDTAEDIAAKAQMIVHLRADAVPGANVDGKIAATDRAAFMTGPSEPGALAALQTRIDELARQSGIRLQSVGSIPSREAEGLHLIGVRVQLTADLVKIHEFLYAIETIKPVLIVDAADWTSGTTRLVGLDPDPSQPTDLMVQASFDVIGAFAISAGT